MIEELRTLSPAEVLLLANPQVGVGELANVTFFDLVLRRVLGLKKKVSAEDSNAAYTLVSTGPAFEGCTPLKHEALFLQVYAKDPSLKMKLKTLVKIAFEDVKTADQYKLRYIYSDRLSEHFKSNFLYRLLGIKTLSAFGLDRQRAIKQELNRLREEVSNKNPSIYHHLLALNGNILLLGNLDKDVFEKLNEKAKEKNPDRSDSNGLWSDAFIDFGVLSDEEIDISRVGASDFDSTLKSIEHFDSGVDDSDSTSVDSGCSGCSGCGGCGGCGG